MLREMEFKRPEFHPGINVTFRKGFKWADLEIGETIAIKDHGYAEVVFVIRCQLKDIPEAVLELEHDHSCHTMSGLISEIRRAYTDRSLGPWVPDEEVRDWLVTVVGLRIFQEL